MPFWSGFSANFVGVILAGLLVNLLMNLRLKYEIVTGVFLFLVSTVMWNALRSLKKKVAYGCGRHGQKLVDGLTLYVRRPDHPTDLTSAMTIRLGDEAVRSIKADLGLSPRSAIQAQGFVKIASEGILVLNVIFGEDDPSDRGYYLVYDSTDVSLYMTPCLPSRSLEVSYTSAPVLRLIGGGGDPQLVLMAHRSRYHHDDDDFLCLCTPASSPGITDRPWDTKMLRFPDLPGAFNAEAMFSFEGKAFWADTSQGLAYCDLRAAGNPAVELDFIGLPYGYEILDDDLPQDELTETEPAEMNRTIGYAGGRVKFICIDRPWGHPCNTMVRTWTLELGCKEWKPERGLLWKELWEQVAGRVLRYRDDVKMWDVEPRYPC
ncbi:hypothetical protein C2845_PM01G23320 [Panicum miliaceum]|uniref:DUF1618 domain-containing protein n=1 Tax=Panicum miliaceum TaxID=4540 RepID=A0A3L6TKM3_PANMI|nr:hypothetical protein C2845_PM01G23320 [Panicum miliaceum]